MMTEEIRYERYWQRIFDVKKVPNHRVIRELDNQE